MLPSVPPATSARLSRSLENAALAAIVILSTGYRFGTGMQLMLVPYLRRLADPEYLRNDWLIGLVPKHYNVTWLLATLSREVDLELLFFLAQVATTFLFVSALRRLSRVLFGEGPVFYLALFVLLRWGAGGLGGNSLFGDYFNPHVLGVPFCMLALASALEGRFVHGALLSGVATNVHMLLGLDVFLLLAIAHLFADRPLALSPLIRGIALYGLVAAPTLLPAALMATGSEALDAAEFQRIHVWMRNPHHYAPSSWPLLDFVKFGFIVLFAALASLRSRPAPDVHRRVVAFCTAVALLCLLAIFALEVVPLEIPTKLQFFRMTIFVRLLASLYVASFLAGVLEEGGARSLAAIALLGASPRLGLLMPLAGLTLTLTEARRRRVWIAALAALVVALAIVLCWSPAPLPIVQRNAPSLGDLAKTAFGAALLALAARFGAGIRSRAVALSSLGLLAVVHVARGPTFDYSLDHLARGPWGDACLWIRAHTPPDAVFIAPPDRGDFRLLAERAHVADFKGNTFWEGGIVEWKRRLEDLSNTTDLECSGLAACREALHRGYNSLRESDFENLARKYGAGFVLTEGQLSFPDLLYSNGRFRVYGVPRR